MLMIILYNQSSGNLRQYDKDDVMDALYFNKARVPFANEISDFKKKKKFDASEKVIFNELKNMDPNEQIKITKQLISKVDNKIPLYNIYARNIFIINKINVYKRVIYQNYRFPDEELLKILKKRRIELDKYINKISDDKSKVSSNVENFKKSNLILLKRELRKLNLILNFLNEFDLEILEETYVKMFYYYSNEVGKNITVCMRPSFRPDFFHVNPYYSRSELINLALNMQLIEPSTTYYDTSKITQLCTIIKQNDISASTLLNHQTHIINNNKIGIVQYYSIQGSFFMNQYLRNASSYKNVLLEENIKSIWELVRSSPAFDKSYTLYRFISRDDHIKNLNPGDIYVEPSFISTTRDPFYLSKNNYFGLILIRIKIPKKMKGVGLCIETISNFPEEQEIILPPLSKLRLDNKDKNVPYYHTDNSIEIKIKTRYEFTMVGSEEIKLISRPIINYNKIIDFLKVDPPKGITMSEKIKNFLINNVNEINQFDTYIGNIKYTVIAEWYNSISAYKKFYAITTTDGFMLYTIINNYLGFTMEFGEQDDEPYMHVNYYFKYSSFPKEGKIKDEDLINFFSKVAYYFGIKNIIMYAEYAACNFLADDQNTIIKSTRLYNPILEMPTNIIDMIKKYGEKTSEILIQRLDKDAENISQLSDRIGDVKYYGGNYCVDFYNYLKFKKKKYNDINNSELKPKFSYYELDRLRTTDPHKILSKSDQDEIYQLYDKAYKTQVDDTKLNIADFYVWMVDYHCIHMTTLTSKMLRLYKKNNPFSLDYYILDAFAYLYNREMIDYIPYSHDESGNIDLDVNKRIDHPKNNYRLEMDRIGTNR